MKIYNHIEKPVINMVKQLVLKRDDVCHCEKCQLDIAAIALNNLTPKYVVSEKGELYTKVDEMDVQFSANLIREITKAIDVVAQRPQHKTNE